ncbi:fucolectin-4-like [Leptodactylus fuscus]|uniref:fucolectin-4-like n=1 Tax=Leptodactylus fuscus TaxID=238119 RepID=UPI003F4EB619
MKLLLLIVLLWIVSDGAPTDRNVALGGRATQSTILRDSVYHTGYMASAMNAIDGNQNSNYHHGSCSHTHDDLSPWWRVDLLKSYRIGHISITNRGDCCGNRLRGAIILVGNSLANNGNDNPRCAVVTTILDGETQTFQCNDMVGRYVNIYLPGKQDYLQLCEVEVYGANLVHENKNHDSNNNQNTEI